MARLGSHLSQATKAKIGAANMGKKPSEETKTKIAFALTGKHHTEEHNAKNSLAHKALCQDPLYRVKRSAGQRALWQDPAYATKMSIAHTGKHWTAQSRAKLSDTRRGKHLSEKTRAKIGASNAIALKGHTQPNETRYKISASMKQLWQDPKFAIMMFQAFNRKPNKAELCLQDILNRHFPNTWKFVGDGQLTIGGKFPDFVNIDGKKEVIELFGEYWHPLFDMAKTKEHYRQYGFRVAIIWEDELNCEHKLIKVLPKKFKE